MGLLRRSLRARIALTFALSVALTALALSLAAYYLTKSAEDSNALDEALAQTRQNLTVADAMLPAVPTESDYEAVVAAFGIRGDFDALLQVGAETYRSGLEATTDPISAELASAVEQGNIRYQQVSANGEPTIVVGSQLRSGTLTAFFFFPQGERLGDLAMLRNILIVAGVLLAASGAVAGSLLAGRLTRPVREASRAAARMSSGDLDIRLPSGADEFGTLADSFNHMAASLQNEMRELEAGQAREKRFVADVSHELRTPISALVGEASLLESRLETDPSACPPDIARLSRMVTTDVARLRQLVDDLLEICRLDAQRVESVIEPVELGPFLERMVEAHNWTQSVAVHRDPSDPRDASAPSDPAWSQPGPSSERPSPKVLVDRRLLERIMVNLVENALTHGAAPVSVQYRGVAHGRNAESSVVSVAVTDSGAGIPLQDLPHVFDRFYKADPSRGSSRGSGLGLAIAQENARLMGGDITAANLPGHGARFVLTLPPARP